MSVGNIVNYIWIFDDNHSNTPPFKIKGPAPNPTRLISTEMKSHDKLVVVTEAGCRDSITLDLFEMAFTKANLSYTQPNSLINAL